MAAVIVPINRLGDYRKAMAGLRTKGSLAFHMRKEKTEKRAYALKLLLVQESLRFFVATSRNQNSKIARAEVLRTLIAEMKLEDSWNLILDRSSNQQRDFETLIRISRDRGILLEVSHASRYEDVGLWGPDVLAWYASKISPADIPAVTFLRAQEAP